MDGIYLNYLYVALTIFILVIGFLLALVLLKVNKILTTVTKVTNTVEKGIMLVGAYKQVPDAVKEKIKSFMSKKK